MARSRVLLLRRSRLASTLTGPLWDTPGAASRLRLQLRLSPYARAWSRRIDLPVPSHVDVVV